MGNAPPLEEPDQAKSDSAMGGALKRGEFALAQSDGVTGTPCEWGSGNSLSPSGLRFFFWDSARVFWTFYTWPKFMRLFWTQSTFSRLADLDRSLIVIVPLGTSSQRGNVD